MIIYEEFLKLLNAAIEKYGNANKLAEKLGVHPNLITRWKNRERVPNLQSIQPLADLLGWELTDKENNASHAVCFVQPNLSLPESDYEKPVDEDYLAAPIISEVGAGPGYLPENEISGWFMIRKHSIRGRGTHQLIAVIIAPHSISMQPTLMPGDVVLIDRDDTDASKPGKLMLVQDPIDGSGMIKRVSLREKKNDVEITYYSDNTAICPPQVYSLARDFDGDMDKAIVGRVIWAWSDMRGK